MPATHIVVYQTHLHALTGLVYKRVCNETAQRIVVYDVNIKMYVVVGAAYLTQQ